MHACVWTHTQEYLDQHTHPQFICSVAVLAVLFQDFCVSVAAHKVQASVCAVGNAQPVCVPINLQVRQLNQSQT